MFFLAAKPPPVIHEQAASPYLDALTQKAKRQTAMDELFNRIFVSLMAEEPQTLTSLGFFEAYGVREHNRVLNDYSIEAAKRWVELAKKHWMELQIVPREMLTPEEELSRQVISLRLQETLDGEKFLFHTYLINQLWGVTQQLTGLFMNDQPLNVPQDGVNYLIRLGKIGGQFQEVIGRMEYQREKGILPPRFAIAKAIASLEKWTQIPIEKNPFYTRLETQGEEVQAQAREILENEVYPAYQGLLAYLKTYIAHIHREDGVWALPDGDEYYAYMLKVNTTLDLSAEEVHELGIQEVDRIEREAADLLKQEGLWNPEWTLGQHLQELSKDPKHFFPNTDEGRAACLKKFDEILARSRKELWPLFSLQPASKVKVEAVPAFEAEGASAAYYVSPSLDGSRPGAFFVNLRDLNTLPMYRMETLAVHEAEPGHHFQRSLAAESDTHILRKLSDNTAYCEGWALYCEKLAYEQGFYSSRLSRIGHLQDELLRAARLVVDTGIHWKRWTREEAIEYLSRTTGMRAAEVVSEIERYFVLPGQACAYKIGQLKILALRKEEKERLGDQFDLKAFHERILGRGALPLSLL